MAERYDAKRSQSFIGCGYPTFMKTHLWNPQRTSAKKMASLEKQERKRSLIERLTQLNRRNFGTIAHSDPFLVDALSLVRVNQLEKIG